MKFVLAGGGTGGHVYPGVSLGEELRARGGRVSYLTDPRAVVYFAGVGENVRVLNLRHLSRTGLFPLILFALRLLPAVCRSIIYLWGSRPDLVVGLGGFVSFPPLLAARLLSLPTALLEQNSVPGLVTRLLARRVRQVHLTYEESAVYLDSRVGIKVSGNPVRRSVLTADRETGRDEFGLYSSEEPVVAVMGGSQGAHRLNLAVAEWFGTGRNPLGLRFLVITGVDDVDMVRTEAGRMEPSPLVYPFVRQIDLVLAACDMVVSRSGATAVAEITARGLPAVFVPYPYAKQDHQRLNVESLRAAGGCRVIADAELDGVRLRSEVEALMDDRESLKLMAEKSRATGHPRAAGIIADSLIDLIRGRLN
jgi:UDP-N-acetylglucosamine--N-acetylmuramyl-(pentapeptide) pyrophosphoryl-undecaprenol N-acetylglucosamine transferase